MTTNKPELHTITDAEGDGTCGACGREGLRWIAVLTDGSRVGLECAKSVLGYSPARKDYAWQESYTLVASYEEYGQLWQLWQHKERNTTATSRSGSLVSVGGQRKDWTEKGWL